MGINLTTRRKVIIGCYFCGCDDKDLLEKHHFSSDRTILVCANCHTKWGKKWEEKLKNNGLDPYFSPKNLANKITSSNKIYFEIIDEVTTEMKNEMTNKKIKLTKPKNTGRTTYECFNCGYSCMEERAKEVNYICPTCSRELHLVEQ